MEFKTTKERFIALRDNFISELSECGDLQDNERIIEFVQTCFDDVFGEEYKSQLTESEVHIYNSFMTALGVDAANFCQPLNAASTDKICKETCIGAISGLIAGIILSSIALKPSTSLAAGLIIGIATLVGGAIPSVTKKDFWSKFTSNKDALMVDSSLDINKIIIEIERICDKVDRFMNVCRIQLSR